VAVYYAVKLAYLELDKGKYDKKDIENIIIFLMLAGPCAVYYGAMYTEALLHITEAVNVNKLDSSLYTLEKQGTGDCEYDLYNANYQLPFAMVTNSNISLIDFNRDYTKLNAISSGDVTENDYNWNTTTKDWIYLHNLMYSALSGNSEKLVTEYGEFAGAKVYQVGESQVEDINAASDNSATDRPTQHPYMPYTHPLQARSP
jgi:hypothetical protein